MPLRTPAGGGWQRGRIRALDRGGVQDLSHVLAGIADDKDTAVPAGAEGHGYASPRHVPSSPSSRSASSPNLRAISPPILARCSS